MNDSNLEKMNSLVDCVVVGASLSGLMAARALQKQGIRNFLVCDGKAAIGWPLKCGEAVDTSSLEELFGKDTIESAPFVVNRSRSHCVQFLDTTHEFSADYCELDRPQFEKFLALPVRDNIRLNTPIKKIQWIRTGGFFLQSHDFTLRTQSLIVCSGSNYSLHKQLGALQSDPALGYACGGIYASTRLVSSQFLWKLSREALGYAWAFPKKEGVYNMGVAGFDPKTIKSVCQQFMRTHLDEETVVQLGGRFPASGPFRKTYGEGYLLCGDAAGMVFAGTGEGISYALISGKLAGEVIARGLIEGKLSSHWLRTYQTQWKEKFGKKLKMGVWFKRILIFLLSSGRLKGALANTPTPILQSMLELETLPHWVTIKYFVSKMRTRFLHS